MSASEGGGSDSGGGAPGWIPDARPEWWSKAVALFTGGATVAGVSLWQDPVSFVVAAATDAVIGGILAIFRRLGELVLIVNSQSNSAVVSAGSALAGALGTIGSLPFTIVSVLDSVIVNAAGALGPISFVGVIVGWIVAGAILAIMIRVAIELVRLIPVVP